MNSTLFNGTGRSISEDTKGYDRIKCDTGHCVNDAISNCDGMPLCAKCIIDAKQEATNSGETVTIETL